MIEHHIIFLFGNEAMDSFTLADIIQWQNDHYNLQRNEIYPIRHYYTADFFEKIK